MGDIILVVAILAAVAVILAVWRLAKRDEAW